jgi:hypothetical protein
VSLVQQLRGKPAGFLNAPEAKTPQLHLSNACDEAL